MSRKHLPLIVFFTLIGFCSQAQEMVVPLQDNPNIKPATTGATIKKQRATLPFVDDFSYDASVPDTNLWMEQQVFINNTMGINPPTKGVATFDGLNALGRPYRPNDFSAVGFGDSLTSVPIDISFRSPADSLVLSFFVQPQGNGFPPETGDSLYLFFRNNNNQWVEMWRKRGTFSTAFLQEFVSVNDPQFFHDSFQFRFVNFTSLNLNDDVWNIDYVKLDINRSPADTNINDLAFVQPPSSILTEYTAMPYRHLQTGDLSSQQQLVVANLYNTSNTFTLRHTATELNTSTPISANALTPFNMFAKSQATLFNPSYSLGLSGSGPFVIRNTYFIEALNATDRKSNDTIQNEVVFDNYFAYDDGSAEQAYFLNPALNQPSKTAMKFELRQPDSVYGISVYFAAQVPSAAGKFFSVVLYDSLGNSSAGDVILKQQDLYTVQYPAKRGEFSFYAFDQPVGLGPGTYYIGITQPANFSSDSIYYGLDVNNDNNIQKLSYNVNGFWFNSSVNGTVMMRPMVGGPFTPTSVQQIEKVTETILYPNPTTNTVHLQGAIWPEYKICLLNGQTAAEGIITNQTIDLSNLPAGQYIIQLISADKLETHKLWKQ